MNEKRICKYCKLELINETGEVNDWKLSVMDYYGNYWVCNPRQYTPSDSLIHKPMDNLEYLEWKANDK